MCTKPEWDGLTSRNPSHIYHHIRSLIQPDMWYIIIFVVANSSPVRASAVSKANTYSKSWVIKIQMFLEVLFVLLTSLSLIANMTAPACSVAFPTIGSRIMLLKLTETPQDLDASWLCRLQQLVTLFDQFAGVENKQFGWTEAQRSNDTPLWFPPHTQIRARWLQSLQPAKQKHWEILLLVLPQKEHLWQFLPDQVKIMLSWNSKQYEECPYPHTYTQVTKRRIH